MRKSAGGPGEGGLRENSTSLIRTVKKLFVYYPRMAPLTMLCILFSAVVSSVPSLFIQNVLAVVADYMDSGDWAAARPEILHYLAILITLYVLALISTTVYNQLMAIMTQGFLNRLRRELFDGMQDLPVKYFDATKYGDIMSFYTNDIDTLRQLISQSLPAVVQSVAIICTVFAIMLWFSVWLTLVLCVGIAVMLVISKKFGGTSARYFLQQQKAIGALEGNIQEMMAGQKVVKVFCHETQAVRDFDRINDDMYEVSWRGHAFANALGPIINNIGNVMYVLLALIGGILIVNSVPNVSISGKAFDVTILVPFLNMAKQFAGNVNNLAQHLNNIIMAGAGATRVYSLMDQPAEADEGYVTLVNVKEAEDGTLQETAERTGKWAWKHPHGDGTLTYTPLAGDVRMKDVDFEYEAGKPVLQNISVYAEPGQKVAFVGATGAGKTTITNLINRFYDIADGKIRYDGININKIRKKDLRRSLGLVLQDTNLFTGSVMDNIRYGYLEATDEQCIQAAKLAGADDFISRLPDGYQTQLANNGSNLSQGQRQLISIARAAVANPPVMILDEATSSIDTRTEAIVQRGMDKLMEGRTVFVIAHRLSTVMNSDVIMVLDHGRIIERGSHAQLLEQKGTYYQLYTGAFELE